MGVLESLFNQVAGAINEHGSDRTPGPSYDTNSILGTLAGLFSQQAQQNGESFDTNQFGNVRSSDEDKYGDPGAQGSYGNVKSSDQDPYGDPGAR